MMKVLLNKTREIIKVRPNLEINFIPKMVIFLMTRMNLNCNCVTKI